MTPEKAKEILLFYRPGTDDADDPEIADAISLANEDKHLADWFREHCAFQAAVRESLRGLGVPAHLKTQVVLESRIVPLTIVRRPAFWLAAAAAVAVLCTLSLVMFRPQPPNGFANFEARMVSTALRDYRMDIKTNDMTQIRSFLASQGAPRDYQITRGLERLGLTGAGALRWRSHPVSMVCFNRGDDEMLFLFVIDKSALKDPPGLEPKLAKDRGKLCVSWSKGDKAYVLAGPDEPEFLHKYL